MGEADRSSKGPAQPVPFGRTFVHSEAFRALFREGMALVEETAAYLDGPGRTDSRALDRQAALTYASESMRLTTRLMQIASWLLVQRAVAEGDMTPGQASREKKRVRVAALEAAGPMFAGGTLPERLRALVGHSVRLHARILHLDRLMADAQPVAPRRGNPVAVQHWLIRSAFGERA